MKLKKLFAIALLLSCTYTGVFAQGGSNNASDGVVVEDNSFWSNWYVGASAGVLSYLGESPADNMGINPTFGISAGKWFTPVIGLRARIDYANPKGGSGGNFNLLMLSGDVKFNAFNLFQGYDADRVFNLNPYATASVAASGTCKRVGVGVGLNATYTLSSTLDLVADLKGATYSDGLDGVTAGYAHEGFAALTVGVNYRLGTQGWVAYSPAKRGGGASSAELAAVRAELRKTKVKVNDLETELEISEAKVKAKTGLDVVDKERAAYFNSIK